MTPTPTDSATPTPYPSATPYPDPSASPSPSDSSVDMTQLIQMIPEQWQILAVALALLVFTAGVLLAVKI